VTPRPSRGSPGEASLFSRAEAAQPLAARLRPRTLDEYVGQAHILAPGKALRQAIENGSVGSVIFWGPPGSGKTTLGRLIATTTNRVFVPFSAVSEGVPRIRQIIAGDGLPAWLRIATTAVAAVAALYVALTWRLRLQANVENVFVRRYYVNADSNTNISPGFPRTLRVGLTTTF